LPDEIKGFSRATERLKDCEEGKAEKADVCNMVGEVKYAICRKE
jgi:hypothetical protein